MEDPYLWLEDLSSERTLKFIEERNRRFREFVSDLPSKLFSRVEKYYGVPYVVCFRPSDLGIYLLVRDSRRYFIELMRWGGEEGEVVLSSDELGKDVVVSDIYPSLKGDVLGIAYTVGGSDEGFLKFFDVNRKEVLDEVRGIAGDVVWIDEDRYYYVVTNIRGGSEFGGWCHREGMREKKQNVFEDFKAVLKYFKGLGYKVVGISRSNGGLLIAAVLTQDPELLDAAVIGYPVIDMLRFHKLYVGSLWVSEYGNPEDPRDREYLLKYSPYHNVRKGSKYPPTLVYTGLHDDRVHPGHALKFVAKLEEVGAPIYLRVELISGHRGASPKVKVKELSDVLAFIYKIMKLSSA